MAVKIPTMLGRMSPTYQKAWYKKNKMPLPPHLTGSAAKASKEVKPSERVKSLQAKSLKAYGATKGAKVGGEHGGEEMRDTIAPLTRDQHSKVQAAERAAKAAAKKAAPAKPKKPLSQSERMAAIARAVTKAKAKDRFDVPTVDPNDVDHDDLRDVHQSLHVRKGYNEEVESVEEGVATAQKVMDRAKVVATSNPDPKKRFAASGLAHKAMLRTINPTGVNTGITRGGGNKTYRKITGKAPPYQLTKKTGISEEAEQIDELKSSTLQSYLDKRPSPKIRDVARPETVGKPEERAKDIARANLTRIGRARAKVKLLKRNPPPRQAPTEDPNDRGYGKGRYMGDDVNLEGQVMNEVSKKEAEKVLGGPVKEKPKMAPGKQPAGYRYVRNLARKAMKKGMKEEVEQVVEQDDSMEKKEMAQTQLHFIGYAAKEILEFIDMGGEIEEWYQNKLSKVQSEVESLHSYIEGEKRRTGMVKEEEQIDEKAPPGAKYERMVKHIKKGYAKGGLTAKEKSIAYATAWKAYGKKEEVELEETAEPIEEKYMGFKKVMAAAKAGGARNPAAVAAAIGRKKYGKEKFQAAAAAGKKMGEEVEVVAEAEGTVAVTPKEKALAAHHGDPKKITYGDVIKARLKSVAAKKMGK